MSSLSILDYKFAMDFVIFFQSEQQYFNRGHKCNGGGEIKHQYKAFIKVNRQNQGFFLDDVPEFYFTLLMKPGTYW